MSARGPDGPGAAEHGLARAFAGAAVGLAQIELDGTIRSANDALSCMLGRSRQSLLGRRIAEVTFPADLASCAATLRGVLETGETASIEKRFVRPDGSLVFAQSSLTPLRDEAGAVNGLLALVTDLTARRQAEETLRQSEQRLRLALSAGNLATWDWDLATGAVVWSDEHFRMQGLEPGSAEPSFDLWASLVHPDDLPRTLAAVEAARDNHTPYEAEFRIVRPDGTVIWCICAALILYDAAGAPCRMVGVQRDITERREWADRQQALIAELQHRTRNLLGVVRALADKTALDAPAMDGFLPLYRGRLGALARVNDLLSQLDAGQRVAFDDLLRAELGARGLLRDEGAGRVVLSGPRGVRLRSASVQTLALAIHELAAECVKSGALSTPEGRLKVGWSLSRSPAGERRLRIEWQENGLAAIPPPAGEPPRGSFGRDLIERGLPYQLRARTLYERTPDGLLCSIDLPLGDG